MIPIKLSRSKDKIPFHYQAIPLYRLPPLYIYSPYYSYSVCPLYNTSSLPCPFIVSQRSICLL